MLGLCRTKGNVVERGSKTLQTRRSPFFSKNLEKYGRMGRTMHPTRYCWMTPHIRPYAIQLVNQLFPLGINVFECHIGVFSTMIASNFASNYLGEHSNFPAHISLQPDK